MVGARFPEELVLPACPASLPELPIKGNHYDEMLSIVKCSHIDFG
jgi:hypothetical protein